MKLLSSLFLSAALVAAGPLTKRDVDPALVPEFGVQAGVNPSGKGDCDGSKDSAGNVVRIPCICPPDRAVFLKSLNANVAAGRVVNNTNIAVSFLTGDDEGSKFTRMHTAIATLQNFNGPGAGCPASSTTFSAQLKAILDGTDVPSTQNVTAPPTETSTPKGDEPAPPTEATPTPKEDVPAPQNEAPTTTQEDVPASETDPVSESSPPPSNDTASPTLSSVVDRALVPEFGHQAGLNPTGSGECDGITNKEGKVVKIPCFCPPDREVFIEALSANVAAGHAVNNTVVPVSFPTGDDKGSKLDRVRAALVTLQNLRGPGVGCPASSTTFGAQEAAIHNLP